MKKLQLIGIIFFTSTCFSQNIIDLNSVTISSSRIPQKITETGRNIATLDGKLFKYLPINSIDELLKFIPGVEIQQRGPAGAQSDIVIRGGTFQQVLVLLDGIKINDPITGHFSTYIPITPAEIERIEILKGPAAAIYGAEAVGGVVSIISKIYNNAKKEKSTNGTFGTSIGEYGFASADANVFTTSKKINYSLSALTNNANGQKLRGNNKGYFHNHTATAALNYAFAKNWKFLLRSSYDIRDFAAQNFYTNFVSDTATEKVKTWWNQAKIKHGTSKHSDEIDFAYKQTTDYFLFNPKSIANNNVSNLFIGQYLHTGTINKSLKINYGAQLSNRKIKSNDRGNHITVNKAIFLGANYFKNKFSFNPSLRLDNDENYGTEILPQLNLSYQIKKIYVRANTGRAIRSADFTERYNNYNKTLVTSGSIGNPNLIAEKSWSYEAGADYFFKNKLKISGTLFYRNQNNVIDWVNTSYANMPRQINLSPTGNFSLSKNIKTVKTRGIELDFTYQKNISINQNIYFNTGFTILNSSSNDTVPSFYIISHAKKLWQTSIMYNYKKLSVAFNTIYKERNGQAASNINAEITKNYFLINTKIQVELIKNWQIFVSVNNITNISYSDLLGSKMPLRWFTGGFRFNF